MKIVKSIFSLHPSLHTCTRTSPRIVCTRAPPVSQLDMFTAPAEGTTTALSPPLKPGLAPSGSPPVPALPPLLPAEQSQARAPVQSQPCISHSADPALHAQHGYNGDLVQGTDEDTLLTYHGYHPAVRTQPWHPLAASIHPGPRDVHIAALNAATNSDYNYN